MFNLKLNKPCSSLTTILVIPLVTGAVVVVFKLRKFIKPFVPVKNGVAKSPKIKSPFANWLCIILVPLDILYNCVFPGVS